MSESGAHAGATEAGGAGGRTELRLEVVVIPVADADRSKAFYGGLGWRLDADLTFDDGVRIVQFTPPGSRCSIQFGVQLTPAAPGTAHSLYLVVDDIEAARAELAAGGASVSDAFHAGTPGAQFRVDDTSGRASGPAPEPASYKTFATFEDPDGNSWLLQEITKRLPGRIEPGLTSYGSAAELADAMRRAEAAHGEHEKRIGAADPNWPDWYAEFMVREQAGLEPPT
jgi:catechol 2,3-dioxygenase-like lactoylglutathione lyase family enzyme